MNSASERINRTLLNKGRTMIMDTNLPKNLLRGESVICAAYQLNRFPTDTLHEGISSEIWDGD